MKVFKIEYDVDNFQSLLWNKLDNGKSRRLEFDCEPISVPLTPPDVYSLKPKLQRGDFWMFNRTFAIPPSSFAKVQPFLEEAGQVLTLPYKSEEFQVLNALNCVDCVDKEKSTMSGIKRFAFVADLVPRGIFKVPYSYSMFVGEFTCDAETEFKTFVEKNGLTGLKFVLEWSNE